MATKKSKAGGTQPTPEVPVKVFTSLVEFTTKLLPTKESTKTNVGETYDLTLVLNREENLLSIREGRYANELDLPRGSLKGLQALVNAALEFQAKNGV